MGGQLEQPTSGTRSPRSRAALLLRLALAAGIFVWLVRGDRLDTSRFEALHPGWAVATTLFMLGILVLPPVRWWLLCRGRGLPIGLRGVVHIALIGTVAGRLMWGSLSNDAVRLAYMGSRLELYEQRTSFRQREYVQRWGFAATANMFTWRAVFDHVGRFADDLLSMGDREWGTRVSAAGYAPVYGDDVVIVHPARATLSSLRIRTRRTTGGFLGLILRKRWSVRSIVRDVPLGLLPARVRETRDGRPLPAVARLKILSVSGFVLAVRALEIARLASGGEPVCR